MARPFCLCLILLWEKWKEVCVAQSALDRQFWSFWLLSLKVQTDEPGTSNCWAWTLILPSLEHQTAESGTPVVFGVCTNTLSISFPCVSSLFEWFCFDYIDIWHNYIDMFWSHTRSSYMQKPLGRQILQVVIVKQISNNSLLSFYSVIQIHIKSRLLDVNVDILPIPVFQFCVCV